MKSHTDIEKILEKILDQRDLSFGEIHAQGKEISTDDLLRLNREACEKAVVFFESKLKKERELGRKETHSTHPDYCCACEYDLAVFESKIDKVKKRFHQQGYAEGFTKGMTQGYLERSKDLPKSYQKGREDMDKSMQMSAKKSESMQTQPTSTIKEIRIYGGPIIITNLVLEVVAKLNEVIKKVNLLSKSPKQSKAK